jgi:hypothetical protein
MNYMIANCKGCRHDSLTKPCAVKAKIARGGVPQLVRTGETIANIDTGEDDPVVTCLERSEPKQSPPKPTITLPPLAGQMEIFA